MEQRSATRIVLHFPEHLVDQPIITRLVREHDLSLNILKATINPHEQGLMVMELLGEPAEIQKGCDYLRSLGIGIQSLTQDLRRNDEKCIQCGQCVSVCPSGAQTLSRPSMEVALDGEKCIACEACVAVCPTHALSMNY